MTVGPSSSGGGHSNRCCETCGVQIFSHFGAIRNDKILLFKATTLDESDQYPPQAHIFTSSKLPWVELISTIPSFEEFYVWIRFYSQRSLERSAKIE